MDRRGRGSSTDTPDYDIMREAQDVAAVVEGIGESVSVIGHSYGAVCSLEASLLTDAIGRLVLYEPPIPTGLPFYPPGLPDRLQELIDGDDWEKAVELFFREVVGMPESALEEYRLLEMWVGRIQLAPTIPRELAIDRAYRFDSGRFANLTTPTLLLQGGDSPPLFVEAVKVVDAALPNSTVVVLPGQQHGAIDTNRDLFVVESLRHLLS